MQSSPPQGVQLRRFLLTRIENAVPPVSIGDVVSDQEFLIGRYASGTAAFGSGTKLATSEHAQMWRSLKRSAGAEHGARPQPSPQGER
jgi:hypothetical protein